MNEWLVFWSSVFISSSTIQTSCSLRPNLEDDDQMEHRKTKPTWMSPKDPDWNKGGTYPVKSPWDKRGDEAIQEFERALNTTEYEYHSMFEVPELSAAKQKQIDDYNLNPPFRTSYNIVEEPLKTQRKLAPGKNPPTRQPWTYGSLPSDPVPMKIHEKPPTALWAIDPKDLKTSEVMESSGDPVLDSLRAQLKSHGASGIAGLARKFKIMDDDGSGSLSLDEFRKGMKECDVCELSDKAVCHLFRYFDRDDSGFISYDEFLVGIRGVLNSRRKSLVHLAFKILDRDGSGRLDMEDIQCVYNARSHPDVVQGRKTEQEILKGFIESFEVGRNKDSVVTVDEFESYYANISASIDSDDYFELMIRNAWHISGGEGAYANTTNRRVLVTRADGTQAVEEIKNDIGIRANDKDAMIAKLRAQGINVGTINLNGSAGMNNQKEAKDVYQTRVNQQHQQHQQPLSANGSRSASRNNSFGSQQQQQQQQQYTTRSQQNQQHQPQSRGSQPLSSSSSGAARGGSNSQQPPLGPQRLSGYVDQHNDNYTNSNNNNKNNNYAQQPNRSQGGSVSGAVKPVRLSDLLATSEGGGGGGYNSQQSQQRPQSGSGYRR